MTSITKAGSTVGKKYRLVRPIGAGTMGTVWAAEEIGSLRGVALKLLAKPTPELRQRFLREARLSARLSHPNIVRLLDVSETDEGEPFLVLELLSGESLDDMLKNKRRIEPVVAARIARDIANALEAAHQAKIVHRDLKPANVFLHHEPGAAEGSFVVKVLDFGIAKSLGSLDETQATMTGMVVGSPGYMSPEQLAQRGELDPRTDLWSLGVLLYELLAGVRPFMGPMQEVVRQVLIAPIPPLSSRVRDVPPELEDIVMRCLERDRDKRIATAAELMALLTPLVESSGVWRSHAIVSPAKPEGTALLSPDAPAPDPLPPWRREMQASLSAHRRTSTSTASIPLTPVVATAPEAAREEPATIGGSIHRRKQGRAFLFVSFGLAAAAMIALVVLVVVGLPGSEVSANADVEPAPTTAPQAPPTKPMESLEPKRSGGAPATPPAPTTTQTPPPLATNTPAVALSSSAAAPVVVSARPSSTYTPLPPCSSTLRVRCRNVQPGSTSAGGVVPNPYGTSKTITDATKNKSKYAPSGI